jgi:hypothetical protein
MSTTTRCSLQRQESQAGKARRTSAVQRPTEVSPTPGQVVRGADQRQVREGLREVALLLTGLADLLGVQPEEAIKAQWR